MATYYNNVPQPQAVKDSSQQTIKLFDNYLQQPITVDAATYDAVVGYFTSRGWLEDSAQSTAYIIIKQAILDQINPFTLIDKLKGLTDVQLSSLITELLNYNRYKSSSLGQASSFTPADEVARNILA